MINFHSVKKPIVAFLLFVFLFVNAAPVKATGVEIFVLIVFAGKVYSYSSMAISAITALTSADTTKKISEESEKNIEDYIETIGERVEAADREANFAKTEEETKKAMEKAAALRSSQTQYINYLNAVRQNKAFVFKEILMEEAKGQAKGYVQGQIKSYILDDDVLDAGTSIVQGLSGSGKSAMEGKTSAAITEADRAFVESLKEGEVTGIRVAITKAEWDKFVNTVAKEEFKSYLMGESETFKNLPLSIQEKYWQKLFLLTPDEIDEIHNIMKQARETGNYFDALEEIIEKHPYYKNTFINLTKDLFGSDEEWIKKLEEELRNKLEKQEEELEELKKEEAEKEEQKEEEKIEEDEGIIHTSGKILGTEPYEVQTEIWEKYTVIDGKIDIWIDMRYPDEHDGPWGEYTSYPTYAKSSGWSYLEFQCEQLSYGGGGCTYEDPGCTGWAKTPFSTEKICYKEGEWYPPINYKPKDMSAELVGTAEIPMSNYGTAWIKETYPSATGHLELDIVWQPEESDAFWLMSEGIDAAVFSGYSVKGTIGFVEFSSSGGGAGKLPDWVSKY